MEDDDWDPNNWPEPMPWRALYLDDSDDTKFCIVDCIDYEWANKYKWRLVKSTHPSRGKNGGDKVYVVTTDPKNRHGTVFLHKEIVARAKGPPPHPKAIIGDHINGDSLDDRRRNLQWATAKENRWNRHGLAYYGKLI